MPKFITPTDITHSTDATWTDVDVSAYVGSDAGNVAGVLLQIRNNATSANAWGIRKNGSSHDVHYDLNATTQTYAAIGVDAGDVFELYLEDASDFGVYLLGYVLNDETVEVLVKQARHVRGLAQPARASGRAPCRDRRGRRR